MSVWSPSPPGHFHRADRCNRRLRPFLEPLETRQVLSPLPGGDASQVGIYQPDKDFFAIASLDTRSNSSNPIAQATAFNYGYHTPGTFAVPLEGDFNGDGITDVGVYLPDQDLFALTYLNSKRQMTGQTVFRYGYHTAAAYAVPLVGDFNGDGITDVGVYLPDQDLFALAFLSAKGTIIGQSVFTFGQHTPGTFAVPITGDFNGDGITDVGVYLPDKDLFELAYLDAKGQVGGQIDFVYGYHTDGIYSEPIVGDFNGDGITDVGVYLPDKDLFALRLFNAKGTVIGATSSPTATTPRARSRCRSRGISRVMASRMSACICPTRTSSRWRS